MELPDVPLFRGLTADEAEAAVTALRMRRRAFAKGEILLEAGQRAPALGVVLTGRVHMEHLDVWGSKTLLGQAGPGDLFAETYACLPRPTPVCRTSRCGSALWPQKTARHCFWRPGSFCSAAASRGAGS